MFKTLLPRASVRMGRPGIKNLAPICSVRAYLPLPPPRSRRIRPLRATRRLGKDEQPEPEYYQAQYVNSPPLGLSDNAYRILSEPTLVVKRNIELMNLFLGFEQANMYDVMNIRGELIGRLVERDFGIGKMIMRQITKLHRPFDIDLLDLDGRIILNIKRGFSLINSHIKVLIPDRPFYENEPVPDYRILGETVQQWHLWRRKYNLFEYSEQDDSYEQFAAINAPFLSFDFVARDQHSQIKSMINRTWGGLGIEFFTDVSVYVIRFDRNLSFNDVLGPDDVLSPEDLNLKQRAVLLANSVSIDFDYFSRHSRRGNTGFISWE